jgi:hypothetical protein
VQPSHAKLLGAELLTIFAHPEKRQQKSAQKKQELKQFF